MTNYTVTTTFGSFRFAADLAQASANIYSLPDRDAEDGDEGGPTPYQTADARHDEMRAAILCLKSFGHEYWLSPMVERDWDDDGQTYDGMTEDAYLRSLIASVEAEEAPAAQDEEE